MGNGENLTSRQSPPKNPLTDRNQNSRGDYVGDINHHAKSYTDRIRDFVLRMRDFTHLFASAIFSFLVYFQSPKAKTRTSKDAVPRLDVPFVVQNP